MTVTTVTKRAGHAVPYDRAKIRNAIAAASKEYVHPMTGIEIDEVTSGGVRRRSVTARRSASYPSVWLSSGDRKKAFAYLFRISVG